MYAILETGSKQYRVAPGDTIQVEKIGTERGKQHTFERVLMVNQDGKFSFGSPAIDKATIVGEVVEHIRGPKKIAFKMKRRKGYHRKVGHRQDLTVIKITEIKI